MDGGGHWCDFRGNDRGAFLFSGNNLDVLALYRKRHVRPSWLIDDKTLRPAVPQRDVGVWGGLDSDDCDVLSPHAVEIN